MLRRAGIALLSLKAVVLPVFFDPSAYVVFAHPKALASHALGFVLLGVLGALALRHGPRILPPSPIHWAVAAVVTVNILATVTALDGRLALFGALDRQLGLVTLLDSALIYVGLVVLVRTRGDLIVLGGTVAAATLALLLYATVQRAGLDPIRWRSGIAAERPFAMLGNPGNLAQYFGVVAAGAGAILVAWWPPMTRAQRLAVAALTMAAAAGAIVTGTRAVALGLGATGAVLGAAAVNAWVPGRARAYVGAAAGIVTIALALTSPGAGAREILGTGLGLVTGQTPLTSGSIASRIDIYQVALREIAGRPLLGVGPDNFVAAYPSHRAPGMSGLHESEGPETSPHSWPLKTATDAGLLGLGSYAILLGTAWVIGRRGGLGLVGIAMTVSFLATGAISISDVGTEWLLFVGLGLIALSGPGTSFSTASAPGDGRPAARHAPRRSGPATIFAALAIATCLALALPQYNALSASRAAADARQARLGAPPRIAAAVTSAQRSVAMDAGRPEYWQELGLAHVAGGEMRQAERAFRRAAELAPYQAAYLTNLAKAQVILGRTDPAARAEAVQTAKEAAAADPYVADVHFTLALALYTSGLFAEAAAASERGWEMRPDPGGASGFEVAVRSYRQIGRPADAERWARAAIERLGARNEWLLLLARILLDQGRTREALAEVERVLQDEPTHAEAQQLRSAIRAQSTP
jgi:tetratricopeptide (TPR) repeat protein/O-antigen ligase